MSVKQGLRGQGVCEGEEEAGQMRCNLGVARRTDCHAAMRERWRRLRRSQPLSSEMREKLQRCFQFAGVMFVEVLMLGEGDWMLRKAQYVEKGDVCRV